MVQNSFSVIIIFWMAIGYIILSASTWLWWCKITRMPGILPPHWSIDALVLLSAVLVPVISIQVITWFYCVKFDAQRRYLQLVADEQKAAAQPKTTAATPTTQIHGDGTVSNKE